MLISQIRLPTARDGSPDYAFMSQYISDLSEGLRIRLAAIHDMIGI